MVQRIPVFSSCEQAYQPSENPVSQLVTYNSLLCSGCIVSGATACHSVHFNKVRVALGRLIKDAVVLPNVMIDPGVALLRTIIDKHCCLPDGF